MINQIKISHNINNGKKPVVNTVKSSCESSFNSLLGQDVFCKTYDPKWITFKGLTKELSNNLYSTRDQVLSVVDKFKAKNKGLAGNMPPTWIQKISQTNKNEFIKEVYSAFAGVAEVLGSNSSQTTEAGEILSNALKKAGIINKNDIVSLEFINYGSFGLGYLLEIPVNGNFERYVLKIAPEKRFNDNFSHGLDIEINRALFLSKNAGKKSDRAPFYFADFRSGYMLVKCIDGTLPKPKITNLQRYCLLANDDSTNIIYHHKIEYGGLVINSPAARTKTSRWVYKQVVDAPENKKDQVWIDIYNDKKLPNRDEVELGLASSVKFLTNRAYFTELLLNNNPSKLVKLGLLDKLFFADGYEYFDKIINDADIELRIRIIESIPSHNTYAYVKFVNNSLNYLKDIDFKKQPEDLLQPTVHDFVEVVLQKMSFLSDEEKKTVFDHLLAFKDDKTNVLLAKNLCKFDDQTTKEEYFHKLYHNASLKVINALIPALTKIDNTLAKSYYKEMALNINDEIRAQLVIASSIFSKNEQVDWFKKLAKNAESKTKFALIYSIKALPENYRYKFILEHFPDIKDLDPETKIILAHNLYAFSKDESYLIYDKLADNLSDLPPKLLNKLFIQLKYFKEDRPKQEQLFRKFASIDNKSLKLSMIAHLKLASEDFKPVFVENCTKNLEGKDSFFINRLIREILILPPDRIVEIYKEFNSFNEPQINEKLIDLLPFIPSNIFSECFDLFVKVFMLLSEESKNQLVSLIQDTKAGYNISNKSKTKILECLKN